MKLAHCNTHICNKVSKGVSNSKDGKTDNGIRESKDETECLCWDNFNNTQKWSKEV